MVWLCGAEVNLIRLLLAIFGIEVHRKARKVVKRAADAVLPPEEEPFPLTMREVSRQQEQIRRATTILPPKG